MNPEVFQRLAAILILLLLSAPLDVLARGGSRGGSHGSRTSSGSHSYSKSGSSNHSGKTYVHGYTRKDGTHVKEYNRSSKVSSSAKPTASKHEPNMPATSSVAKRDSRGRTARSSKAKVSFMKKHPCPSTGKTSRACQGYVVDHIVPLKRGGSDSPSNMQWQTVQAAKAKDKSE